MKIDESRFVAHRGYASKYPENTLLAMSKAIEAGAYFLECDIQLTLDHVPLLHHDPDIKRSTGRRGTVMDLTFEELSDFSFGEPARFGEKFAKTPITTLKDIAGLLSKNPNVQLFVELKEESICRFGAGVMLNVIVDTLKPVIDQCIAISFDENAVMEAKKWGFKKTGWVLRRWNNKSRKITEALSPDYIFGNYKKIKEADDSLWKGPWKWALYEITDSSLAIKWFKLGADMVETMEIGEMLDAFKKEAGNA
ncbi:Glycerophosphoryl diester phosphodiesterase [hydrothermal vent metagenome]|uniref:Glycerophosphoryl diester phosphodiesterase n=1 Tax=hydrothermal vent metagenome TaxID=652676 RepID=A0A3B1C237_9ZZZZ